MTTRDIQNRLRRNLRKERRYYAIATLYGLAVAFSIGASALICLAIYLIQQ